MGFPRREKANTSGQNAGWFGSSYDTVTLSRDQERRCIDYLEVCVNKFTACPYLGERSTRNGSSDSFFGYTQCSVGTVFNRVGDRRTSQAIQVVFQISMACFYRIGPRH